MTLKQKQLMENRYFTKTKMKNIRICNGKVYIEDERWITINADEESGHKGQHVLIKENGDIIFGLGGKFKNIKNLSRNKEKQEGQKNSDLKQNLLSQEERDIMNSRFYTKSLLDNAENLYNISYNRVKEREKTLSDSQIIDIVSGGDETDGSCASVALAYIGQKCGLDVRDFRGGHSNELFSYQWTLNAIVTTFPDHDGIFFEDSKVEMTIGKRLLKNIKEGKEYLLSVGAHAAIVRKKGEKIQYLQLQSAIDSGWKDFNQNPEVTLKNRFGCSKYSKKRKGTDHTILNSGILVEIDKFKNSKEFKIILGYINTAPENEVKGGKGLPK